jgi:thioredoxin reductase (NADPH)
MNFNPLFLLYATPLLTLWIGWSMVKRQRSQKLKAIIADNLQAGLNEPQSLHPVIDPALCLGCAACVRACPEHDILGIVDGKAILVEPTLCVGHGACASSCPTKAISLVFGTETRGVDIPMLSPQFETNVPGIFIAGELGGMGLIKNAIEQGRQAADHAATKAGKIEGGADVLDVLIVGCGPAGISASLGVMEKKLKFRTIDQATLGGTVAHFPRGKLVMTAPATLPIVGQVKFGEISKERLLDFWEDVLKRTGLKPQFEEQVSAITRSGPHFDVVTSKGSYRTKTVILAIGRRGTPRPLEVPGEELAKVVYRLIDPEQYVGRKVLVVGGGDSALEAAARIAEQPDTRVTLAYRGKAYSRARGKNRDRVTELAATGRLKQLLDTTVRQITPEAVELECNGELRKIDNDDIIVCAGGLLPTQFLHDTGISVETKFGTV